MCRKLIIIALTFLAVASFLAADEYRHILPYLDYTKHPKIEDGKITNAQLVEVATSKKRWTGVAVSWDNRMFVCFPRWSDDINISVAELLEDGGIKAYPDAEINRYSDANELSRMFVCVQSVYADNRENLWILDAANPKFEGVVAGGAKLVKVNLRKDEIEEIYYFDESVVLENSYLNDVRIDNNSKTAYITDSGMGALIILNLESGKARRLLGKHKSTQAEDFTLKIDGKEWLNEDGTPKRTHSDGIALRTNRRYLYYQSLVGRGLYRVPTLTLRNEELTKAEIGEKVEFVAETGAVDGIIFDRKGNLYLSSLEDNAIKRLTPKGEIQLVVTDPRIKWPDSFAIGPEGEIYFTTSQIHLGDDVVDPFRIFKIIYR